MRIIQQKFSFIYPFWVLISNKEESHKKTVIENVLLGGVNGI